jgi:hypothetical protein
MLGVNLVEPVPDQLMVVELKPAGKGDLGTYVVFIRAGSSIQGN